MLCGQWVASTSKIKTHLTRIHKEVYQTFKAAQRPDSDFAWLFTKGTRCVCCLKVDDPKRHSEHCITLHQLLLLKHLSIITVLSPWVSPLLVPLYPLLRMPSRALPVKSLLSLNRRRLSPKRRQPPSSRRISKAPCSPSFVPHVPPRFHLCLLPYHPLSCRSPTLITCATPTPYLFSGLCATVLLTCQTQAK